MHLNGEPSEEAVWAETRKKYTLRRAVARKRPENLQFLSHRQKAKNALTRESLHWFTE